MIHSVLEPVKIKLPLLLSHLFRCTLVARLETLLRDSSPRHYRLHFRSRVEFMQMLGCGRTTFAALEGASGHVANRATPEHIVHPFDDSGFLTISSRRHLVRHRKAKKNKKEKGRNLKMSLTPYVPNLPSQQLTVRWAGHQPAQISLIQCASTVCLHCRQRVVDGGFLAVGAPYFGVLHPNCAPFYQYPAAYPHAEPLVNYFTS